MVETIELGELRVAVTRKNVKHVHLSVHPPKGRVTLVAPTSTRLDVARAYVVSKLGWIRDQQAKLVAQPREEPRRCVDRESHRVWGRRYLMRVVERDAKPTVRLHHRTLELAVRPGSDSNERVAILNAWYRSLLRDAVPILVAKWEVRLGVQVSRVFLQHMKTKWGSCNADARTIRLNTELARKPKDLLEYVVVHEMVHLLEPSHSKRFVALMDERYPSWREARAELNDLPLGAVVWLE